MAAPGRVGQAGWAGRAGLTGPAASSSSYFRTSGGLPWGPPPASAGGGRGAAELQGVSHRARPAAAARGCPRGAGRPCGGAARPGKDRAWAAGNRCRHRRSPAQGAAPRRAGQPVHRRPACEPQTGPAGAGAGRGTARFRQGRRQPADPPPRAGRSRALAFLASVPLSRLEPPRLLYHGQWQGNEVLVQQAFSAGRPAKRQAELDDAMAELAGVCGLSHQPLGAARTWAVCGPDCGHWPTASSQARSGRRSTCSARLRTSWHSAPGTETGRRGT